MFWEIPGLFVLQLAYTGIWYGVYFRFWKERPHLKAWCLFPVFICCLTYHTYVICAVWLYREPPNVYPISEALAQFILLPPASLFGIASGRFLTGNETGLKNWQKLVVYNAYGITLTQFLAIMLVQSSLPLVPVLQDSYLFILCCGTLPWLLAAILYFVRAAFSNRKPKEGDRAA